ncbi:MAG: hypothetical protein ACK5MD_02925 [Flavobacteriales bacterium]
MKTIADYVEEIIQESLYLEESLKLKIVNYSALAEYLVPEVEKKMGKSVKPGAVMMALRRLHFPTGLGIKNDIDSRLNQLGNITLRMNIVDYTFKNSPSIIQNQLKFLQSSDGNQEEILAFTRGIHETNLLVNRNLKKQVAMIFNHETLLSLQENLSAISIELPKESSLIKGLYYQLFKRIAWEGISIYEVVSTTNEITLILNNEVIDKAFSIIKKLKFEG